MLLDLAEQFLLERQIFQHGFDDIVGVAHGERQVGLRRDALDRAFVVAEIFQVGERCAP